MAFLVVEEKGLRRHVPVVDGKVRIGRAPDNDVILMDEKSSRHHAEVEGARGRFTVRDLESRNGCFMDGLRIREHLLSFGDSFTIGQARLTLETEQSTAIDTTGSLSRVVPEAPVSATTTSGTTRRTTSTVAGASGSPKDPRETVSGIPPSAVAAGAGEARPDVRPDIAGALAAFDRPEVLRDASRLLEVVCEFAGRLLPGTRVCLAISERGELIPRSYFNFITAAPREELPRDFSASATKALNSGKLLIQSHGDSPARAYLPVGTGPDAAGVMMLERESATADFSAGERALIVALAAPVAALAGVRKVLDEQTQLRQTVSRLQHELAATTEELQKRLDLQTAELTRHREDLSRLTMAPQFRYDYSGIIGRARTMVELFHLLDKVTDLPVPVLIIGESGTGKELIARALHFNSRRSAKGQFVAENCAALPETLLESELFGHVRGAFTGADRDKIGLFETASGGTILLDEIGETTPALQAKLLRVLEEGEIRPVGSNKTKKVDFRLVAATNRPLEEWVKSGKFRQDLYYRVNVITVHLPPLRERREDIPVLVEHFLKTSGAIAEDGDHPRASSGVLRAMMEYHWPGNVRELENEVRRMIALSGGKKLVVDMLSPAIRGGMTEELGGDQDVPLKELVEKIEARRIQEVMKAVDGNKSKAAELLGLSRLGLRKKMERYGFGDGGNARE
jgi:transcriptional regulator with PAS, ATPase and Fis domain